MDRGEFLEQCFAKDPSLVFRKIGGECLLVPVRKNVADLESIYVLNEVGGRIWELLDPEIPVKQIRETILQEFDVASQEAEEDLVQFLQQLEEIGGIRAR